MKPINTILYVDGACEPKNPGGVATFGWALYWKGELENTNCGFVCDGDRASNNVAEYSALIDALKFLGGRGFHGPLLVRSDSKLLVNQMSGEWRAKSGLYYPYYQEAVELAQPFKIRFEWIPRERNFVSDELSKQAYYDYNNNRHNT